MARACCTSHPSRLRGDRWRSCAMATSSSSTWRRGACRCVSPTTSWRPGVRAGRAAKWRIRVATGSSTPPRHAGEQGLRLRFSRGHGSDRRSRDPLISFTEFIGRTACYAPAQRRSGMPYTRRVFLSTASGLLVASTRLGAQTAGSTARVQGASDRIRIGIIGTGGRARGLMTNLKRLAGAEIVAVCDVYDPRLLQAAEIAGASAAKHLDYRRLLDDRQIDAVL